MNSRSQSSCTTRWLRGFLEPPGLWSLIIKQRSRVPIGIHGTRPVRFPRRNHALAPPRTSCGRRPARHHKVSCEESGSGSCRYARATAPYESYKAIGRYAFQRELERRLAGAQATRSTPRPASAPTIIPQQQSYSQASSRRPAVQGCPVRAWRTSR